MSFKKFSDSEREILLRLPYVGPKVIERLEEIGINNLKKLSSKTVDEITTIVAGLLGSTCWKNSPQSKRAIQNAIEAAKENSK